MTDDMQRARELLAAEYEYCMRPKQANSIRTGLDSTDQTVAAIRAITAALHATSDAELHAAAEDFYNTVATQAAANDLQKSVSSWGLVVAAGARLRVALHDQHSVAVVPNCLEVVPPPALGAHEVHPEAVDAWLDLGKSGERCMAADALEHASGVRQNCDGSATVPEGFVLVPEVMDLDMEVAFCEVWFSKRRCIDDPEMQDAWAAMLAARPQGVKDA